MLEHRDAQFLSKLQDALILDEIESHKLVSQLIEEGYDVQDIAVAAIRLARSGEKNQPIDEISEFRKRDMRISYQHVLRKKEIDIPIQAAPQRSHDT